MTFSGHDSRVRNFIILYVKNHRPGFYCNYHTLYSQNRWKRSVVIFIPFMWRITGQTSIVIIVPFILKNRWKRSIVILVPCMWRITGQASIVITIHFILKNRWKRSIVILIPFIWRITCHAFIVIIIPFILKKQMETLYCKFNTLYVKNHRPGFHCNYQSLYSKKQVETPLIKLIKPL